MKKLKYILCGLITRHKIKLFDGSNICNICGAIVVTTPEANGKNFPLSSEKPQVPGATTDKIYNN